MPHGPSHFLMFQRSRNLKVQVSYGQGFEVRRLKAPLAGIQIRIVFEHYNTQAAMETSYGHKTIRGHDYSGSQGDRLWP